MSFKFHHCQIFQFLISKIKDLDILTHYDFIDVENFHKLCQKWWRMLTYKPRKSTMDPVPRSPRLFTLAKKINRQWITYWPDWNETFTLWYILYVWCKWNRLLAFEPLRYFRNCHQFFIHRSSRWDYFIEIIFIFEILWANKHCRIDKSPAQILSGKMTYVVLKCFRTFQFWASDLKIIYRSVSEQIHLFHHHGGI